MAEKLLIDLTKVTDEVPEGTRRVDGYYPDEHGILRDIREIAVFTYRCRRCEDAPCINVCPEEALSKNADGMVTRATHLCVSCKSCVVICPFGTLMNNFFVHKSGNIRLYDLTNEEERHQFIQDSPPGVVSITEQEEDESQDILMLTENILVKDYSWSKLT